jgi:hypothetical protein
LSVGARVWGRRALAVSRGNRVPCENVAVWWGGVRAHGRMDAGGRRWACALGEVRVHGREAGEGRGRRRELLDGVKLGGLLKGCLLLLFVSHFHLVEGVCHLAEGVCCFLYFAVDGDVARGRGRREGRGWVTMRLGCKGEVFAFECVFPLFCFFGCRQLVRMFRVACACHWGGWKGRMAY